MSISDKLGELSRLHEQGALDDEEFAVAKSMVLSGGSEREAQSPPPASRTQSTGTDVEAVEPSPAPADAQAPRTGTKADQLWKAIYRARRPLSSPELLRESGLSRNDLRRLLEQLVDDGLVHEGTEDRDGARMRVVRARPRAPQPGARGAARKGDGSLSGSVLATKPTGMSATTRRSTSHQPTVGGWGFAVFFFGLLGGAVGYFVLKDQQPERASHVLKWGFIWTVVGTVASWIFAGVLFAAVS